MLSFEQMYQTMIQGMEKEETSSLFIHLYICVNTGDTISAETTENLALGLLWITTYKTQGKIDLRNESGRPMNVKVVGEVSEK